MLEEIHHGYRCGGTLVAIGLILGHQAIQAMGSYTFDFPANTMTVTKEAPDSAPDGTVELGVHIADVSRFVRPGSAVDAEAAKR